MKLRALVGAVLCVAATHFPPCAAQVRHQFDVRVPMRDGVSLSADMWLPAQAGRHPVILMRTPYLKTMELLQIPDLGRYFASRGYVLAVQDVRGRGDSDGEADLFFADIDDGYDTIEWLAAQPWSTGRVCMMGVSYLGAVQWLAARARPPHLVCLASTAAGGFDRVFNYMGGAFLMGWSLPWNNHVSARIYQGNNEQGVDWEQIYRHRPLITMDEALGRRMPAFRRYVEHLDHDPRWESLRFTMDDFRAIDLPVLHITGWFDGDQPDALFYWGRMAEHSPAKSQQYLLIGPWTHAQTFIGGQLQVGEMRFSGESVVDLRALHHAFFERYLRQVTERFDPPRARVYLTGANQWQNLSHYPPPNAAVRHLYLHSGGRANSLVGDGRLSWTEPEDEPPDRYTFDPRIPVPSAIDGQDLGADHRPVERRDDVLVYTSEPLAEALPVLGPVAVKLHAASDGLDTDFTAKLLDVYPDGRAVKLGPLPAGVVRARYRRGYDQPELLTPGRPERFRIELFDVGHVFLSGHRVRLEVSSSAFPFAFPNPNTGNPVATDTMWRAAHQTVYHDRGRPSLIELPVLPRATPRGPEER